MMRMATVSKKNPHNKPVVYNVVDVVVLLVVAFFVNRLVLLFNLFPKDVVND